MPPPPHEPHERHEPHEPHEPPDDIDRWLATFSAIARLPAARRAAVTDELEDHLRCRTRDLMLRGASETEATRKSIAELGEAAELAARFRLAARTPIWRHIMTFSILGLSAAALTLSVIAIAAPARQEGANQPTGVVFRSPAQQGEATSDTLADIRLRIDMHDAAIAEFFEQAGKAAGKPVFVHWDSLPVQAEDKLTLQLGEVSFPTALRLVNTRIGHAGGDDAIDFRLRDGVLEFSTRGDFDQQEAQLVRYDLTPLLSRATSDEIAELIHTLVDPYSWEANGGMTASLHIAGDQMFIKAPQRMFPRIEWILAQFADDAAAADAGPEDSDDAAADTGDRPLRIIPLQHTSAAEIAAVVKEVVAPESASISVDERTNALVVIAAEPLHDRIARLIAALDAPRTGSAGAAGLQHLIITADSAGQVVLRWSDDHQTTEMRAEQVQIVGRSEQTGAKSSPPIPGRPLDHAFPNATGHTPEAAAEAPAKGPAIAAGEDIPLLADIPLVGYLFRAGR